MQNQESNLVYVAALNADPVAEGTELRYIDVVQEHNQYFHPLGGRYPSEPPNYIAFRYKAKLQSLHHIKSYKVIDDLKEAFDLPIACNTKEKRYLYELGPDILQRKNVTTNDKKKRYPDIKRNRRCWCYIDLLLTCDSIAEAEAETKKRQDAAKSID